MALLDRYKKTRLGTVTPLQVTIIRAGSTTTDPFYELFAPRCGDDSRSLVNYLIACQVQRQGTSASEYLLAKYGVLILQRSVKMLLKKRGCTPLTVKRAILLASYRSNFPFTFRYVEKQIDEVLSICPE